jgi:hypothetical protein
MEPKLVNLVNSLGTPPLRLFEYNCNELNKSMSPIDIGRLPFNLLLEPLKLVNLLNLPI